MKLSRHMVVAVVLSVSAVVNAYQTETPLSQPIPVYTGVPLASFNFVSSSQRQSEWCWAASTQMALNWSGVAITQEDIVRLTFGALINLPIQTSSQLINRLNTFPVFLPLPDGDLVLPFAAPVADSQEFFSELDAKRPMLVFAYSGPNSGHVYLATAASYVKNQFGVRIPITVVLRDPWPFHKNRIEVTWNQFYRALIRPYPVVSIKLFSVLDNAIRPVGGPPSYVITNSFGGNSPSNDSVEPVTSALVKRAKAVLRRSAKAREPFERW